MIKLYQNEVSMSKINENLQVKTNHKVNKNNIIEGKGYRISLITPQLVRVESQKDNNFLDDATLCFWNRDLGKVDFETKKTNKTLQIKTEKATFCFNEMTKKMIKVVLDGKAIPCTNSDNLLGTARTLDFTFGYKKLDLGVISKKGVAIIDDSDSLLFADSEVKVKQVKSKDKYIFAYGKDYRGALKDFYLVAGEVPLLPRYALGNWWSRYKAYTQQEYIDLMTRFEKENIPFTVATIDMDWHWVNINEKFGSDFKKPQPFQSAGWTGYSWNTDLFPDRQFFLDWLHNHNYKITVNLHPAMGVRYFEDMYETMAKNMGIDPATKETVKFDISNPQFINNYFEVLHHPYEKEGVNFWWMDWQQGKKSAIKGLDPLWSLNHYHFIDNAKDDNRPMLLSRYSGLGAHRYPVGFSGDTITSWSSLRFQPFFTANAANAGYGWWSHDIGGHTFGFNNDELYLRWCQFGAFSPINRLHSTSHDLQGKEPWFHRDEVKFIVNDFLRLRHKMLPYLYTMNYRAHKDGIAICEPMYYSYPTLEEAYTVRNQYMFGSELMVAPIVSKNHREINKGQTTIWLPKGRYTDIFTGRIYQGERYVTMFRDWSSIPVLAKEGAIIPFGISENNDADNPKVMELYVYRGNNKFTLFEDDGITSGYKNGKAAFTEFAISEEENTVTFAIKKVEGDVLSTVEERSYHVKFKDIIDAKVWLEINGKSKEIEFSDDITFTIKPTESATIKLEEYKPLENPDAIESAKVILSRYQRDNLSKMIMYRGMGKITDKDEFVKALKESTFPDVVKQACYEVLSD
jgi:alpha-glucosidase (family GH31 glycosyl hydrolase)